MKEAKIDGSVLEGGGQTLRIAVGLSALLSRPISIHNIRAGRKPPGLRFQHATGLRLVAKICSADLEGCDTGSTTISFHPQSKPQVSQVYKADPGTAGSIALMMQLRGGTNASQAPQVDYTQHVFLPFIRKHFHLAPELTVVKRGYFPKGGGEVHVSVPPVTGPLPPVTLVQRGDVKAVYGKSYVAGLPRSLADSMRTAAVAALAEAGIDPERVEIESVRESPAHAIGSGSGIILWAETEGGCVLGGSALGSKGKDPARVGKDAAEELARNLAHDGCVDEYMQDQMIIFLALAKGKSRVKTGPLTLHTRTAIWLVEQLSDAKFHVEETETGAIIECDGIGYTPV